MKRRIIWRCTPKPFGFHLVATTQISGKALDINVALSKVVWDSVDDRAALLAELDRQVAKTFDHIDSYAPPGRTLH